MAELDALNIQISASTKKAEDSINNLISTLEKLGGAFDVRGIEGFSGALHNLADAVNSIQAENLTALSTAMADMKKSAKGLADLSANAAKSGDSVSRLSKKLADIVGIKDKNGIQMLTESLKEFLQSTNGEQLSASRNKILTIAKTFGTVGSEISKDREEALRFLNELGKAKINLPMDWTKEYGDSAEGKKLRGMIGIGRTVADGTGSDADDVAKRLGIGDYQNEQDAFKAIASVASIMRDVVAETDDEVLSLGDALGASGEHAREAAEAMQAFTEQLANAVGLTSQQMTDATSGGDGFIPDIQNQNIAIEQFIQNAERLNQAGNPFQNIADGLNEIASVDLNDTLVTYLYTMKEAITSIGGKSGMNAGYAMKQIGEGLQALNVPVPEIGEKVSELAVGLRKLGSGNITKAAEALPFVALGLQQLNGVQITTDVARLAELAKAISGFGYAKIDKAVTNLPILTQELTRLITALSQAPEVSRNTVELVKALGNLNVNARALEPSTRRAGSALDLFSKKAKKAHSSTFSLAATIGKIYASYWAIFRVVGWLGKSIDIASDLTEVQNVVDQTFGNMKYRMEDFAQTAVETIGMSELTAKTIGSRFQAMGRNMGISQEMIESTNDFLQATTKMADGSEKAYADVAHSMADVSINLTRLAGDMASFYNEEYDVVAEKLNAVFTGQTRPLRAYGLDLTQATLQEWALANGMDVNIKKMTQAEKTMLRYQYVMANTTAAHGDFIRTQDTWANTIKRASENLKRLQIILGQIAINTFKPLVANFNSAMNDIIHLAQSTLNSLGKIFGWQIEISDVGIVDDLADGLADVEDGYEGAGKEAKKFKNFLLGIDELNLLPDQDDKDKGSGAGSGIGAMANGIEDSMVKMRETEKGYDSIYDTLFKLGARIAEVQKEWYEAIDWDSIFDKAERFGKGLASFLNGYLADAETFYQQGRFIAEGINSVAHAIYGFFHEFDGYQLGKDIGFELNGLTRNLDWDIINRAGYELAHDITETINGFFENVNWQDLGRSIAEGLNVAIRFVSTIWNEIHWDIIGQAIGDAVNSFFEHIDVEELGRLFHGKIQAILDLANNFLTSTDFEMVGEKIGKFLSELHLEDFADDFAALLWNLFKAAFNLLPKMFEEAPLETALILGVAGFKFNAFGNTLGGSLASSVTASFSPKLVSLLKTDITKATTHSGILGAAELLGTAIGTALVTAITAYVGYNLGLELGKKLHPEDAMWYTQDAIEQAFADFEYWIPAAAEAIGSNRSDFGYFQDDQLSSIYPYFQKLLGADSNDTWGDVKQSLRSGKTYITDSDFEQIKEFLADSGVSASEINNLINQLKDARDAYTNGFKVWMQDNVGLLEREGITVDEAYDRYTAALDEQAEITRKMEALANSPITRYNNAKQIEGKRNELEKEVAAWNDLSEAQQNWARITNNVPEVIFQPMRNDPTKTFDNATRSAMNFISKIGDVGKEQENVFSSITNSLFKTVTVFDEYEKELENVRPFSEVMSGGGGNLQIVLQDMERLNTSFISSKAGLEQLSAAFDTVSSKKDKTASLTEGFETVKSKVTELGQSFSPDAMSKMLAGIPEAFKMAWSDALNVMKHMWSEIAKWINSNAKIEIPKTKVGNQEIGGGSVQLRIPKFDVGGSIPNDGSLFFANEKGPEVMANMGRSTGIMNTDQMEAAIANGMTKALANGNQNVTVVLNGDAASFFTAMVRENNSSIMRTGASPLRV